MGRRVLIIDDNRDHLIVMGAQVQQLGYEVLVASSGDDGLAMAEAHEPDAILLDLIMPHMSGWEVLDVLKQHPTLSSTAVVVVSTAADTPGKPRHDGVQYLAKPADTEVLGTALDRALA